MASATIPIATQKEVAEWLSVASAEVVSNLTHWLNQTLERDGGGASVEIQSTNSGSPVEVIVNDKPGYNLSQQYQNVMPRFFKVMQRGYEATQAAKKDDPTTWDPAGGKDGAWKFAGPLGLRMLNIKSVQFFHFPPLRLVDTSKDYLCDPVPYRWQQLTRANQEALDPARTWAVPAAYETIVDSKTIAAPDNAGKYISRVPEKYFEPYQRDMVNLWLTTNKIFPAAERSFTIPIVVLGIQPMATFEDVFGADLSALSTQTVQCTTDTGTDGPWTSVLGAGHPYRFYCAAQLDTSRKGRRGGGIGLGQYGPMKEISRMIMIEDLIAAGWQVKMAEDPTQNADQVLADRYKYWTDSSRADLINALVLHQASYVTTSEAGSFDFTVSWDEARTYCASGRDPFSFKMPPYRDPTGKCPNNCDPPN